MKPRTTDEIVQAIRDAATADQAQAACKAADEHLAFINDAIERPALGDYELAYRTHKEEWQLAQLICHEARDKLRSLTGEVVAA